MPKKGVKTYIKKYGRKTEHIGFYYHEIVWNVLEDAGPKGVMVRDISRKSEITSTTVRHILKEFMQMNRVKQTQLNTSSKLPQYRYYVQKRWIDVR